MKQLLVLTFFVMMIYHANAQKIGVSQNGTKGTWKLLGSVQASHNADHDAITVKGPYDYFRKLKFKVTDSPLNITKMIVRYDDGGLPENIETRFEIPKGGESRVIDLKGGKRKIKSIEFWYDTKGFLNGKADLTLFGMK